VTADVAEALRVVAAGSPAVLVGEDAESLARVLKSAPDLQRRERLLGIFAGEPADPMVTTAAAEMAEELWRWALRAAAGVPTATGETVS